MDDFPVVRPGDAVVLSVPWDETDKAANKIRLGLGERFPDVSFITMSTSEDNQVKVIFVYRP